MKPVIIIAIAVVCSIIGVLGILVAIDLITESSTQNSLSQDIKDFCTFNYPSYEDLRNRCMEGNFLPSLFNQWKAAGGPITTSEIKFGPVIIDDIAPGGPKNAGAIGSEHSHAGILVKMFGESVDFSAPAYQIKSSWINFEGRDGTTIHKHTTGVTLGYLFDTLSLGLVDDQCFVLQDGRSFCTNEDYSLKFFINGEQVKGIRNYDIKEGDKILISYGAESTQKIQSQLSELDKQEILG